MMPVPEGESTFFGKGNCVGCKTARTDEHSTRASQLSGQRAVQFSSHIHADRRRVILTLNVKGHFHTHVVIAQLDQVYSTVSRQRRGFNAPPLVLQQPLDVILKLKPAHSRIVCRTPSASSAGLRTLRRRKPEETKKFIAGQFRLQVN